MEDSCSCCLLCHLLSLLFLVQLPAWTSTEEFQVRAPSEPTAAVLGGDAVLPCSVMPATNAGNMELRWFRATFADAAFIYPNKREQREEQVAAYAGRTSLVRDFLALGEAALNIHNARVSDNGMDNCFFKMGSFFEEANLELKVADGLYNVSYSPWENVSCSPWENGYEKTVRVFFNLDCHFANDD